MFFSFPDNLLVLENIDENSAQQLQVLFGFWKMNALAISCRSLPGFGNHAAALVIL